SVYAFDADSVNQATPLWHVNLTAPGKRPVLNTDMTGACGGNYNNFLGQMGIVGTPVIDSGTKTLFVVSKSVDVTGNSGFVQYLHALDIRTGAERPNSPVLITAKTGGSGYDSQGGEITFNSQTANQRPGLMLLNGTVFIGFSSYCDWDPYHGWLLAYDTGTLRQKAVYNSTPDGKEGGIWMSGMAPAGDDSGNIYLATGNGTTDGQVNDTNPVNTGLSILKLTPSGNQLRVSSYFTPSNFQYLNDNDLDMGVIQVLLIPKTHLLVSGDKNGELFLVNRDTMGSFNPSSNQVIQRMPLTENSNLHASLAYYQGSSRTWLYTWSENTALTAFPFDGVNQDFNLGQSVAGPMGPYGQNGAFLSVSSNGTDDSTAILWASHAATGDAESTVDPGILRAFSATDVTRELWNSSQDPNDQPGDYAKFVPPTIANGKVYLATFSNQLVVYGLTTKSPDTCNTANIALNKPATASSIENGTLGPDNAFDGSLGTRWSSQFSDPQFISVDLGQEYNICQVSLEWERALGKDFSIQVSDDGIQWTTVQSIFGNNQAFNSIPMNARGRYVRMYGTARGTIYGYSLYEFEVFGKPALVPRFDSGPVVFPNPAQHFLHILKGMEDIMDVELIDLSGKTVERVENNGAEPQVDLPMSNLATGIYIARVRTQSRNYQFKILHVN
ncbi:MAG TPA: discoidin domain-containing protein, partial [Chitinophagaceae bacterium]|nr:discoidin domain-containing protein [Chitinophagaceae bacterium]